MTGCTALARQAGTSAAAEHADGESEPHGNQSLTGHQRDDGALAGAERHADPISWVRWATAYATVPYRPIEANITIGQ